MRSCVKWVGVCVLVALAGCLPPGNSSSNNQVGQFGGRDSCNPRTGCDPNKPDGCFDVTGSFCSIYAETGDAYRAADYNRREIDLRVFRENGWALPDSSTCQAYYSATCGDGCPDWTLDSCSTVNIHDYIDADARNLADRAAEATLTQDQSEIIERITGVSEEDRRSQRDQVLSCVDTFQIECTAIFEESCPSVPLELCGSVFYLSESELAEAEAREGTVLADARCERWINRECEEKCDDRYAGRADLAFCESPMDPDTDDGQVLEICAERVGALCDQSQASLCEEGYPVSLDFCQDVEGLSSAWCQENRQSACDRELPRLCGEVYPFDLVTCADLSQVPDFCLGAGEQLCEDLIATECPQRSVVNCFNPELAPPACTVALGEACQGWEEELCASPVPLTFEVCNDYNRFSQALLQAPPECSHWMVNACTMTLERWEQDRLAAQEICFGSVVYVPPAGEEPAAEQITNPSVEIDQDRLNRDYTTEAGRFDCLNPELGQWDAQQNTWRAAGARVNSCEEYVFKRYYVLQTLLTAMDSFKEDAGLVVELLFSEDPAAMFASVPPGSPQVDLLNLGQRAIEDSEPFAYYQGGQNEPDRDLYGYGGDNWLSRKSQYVLIANPQYDALRAALRQHLPCDGFVNQGNSVVCVQHPLTSNSFTRDAILARNNGVMDNLESEDFLEYHERSFAFGPQSGWAEMKRRVDYLAGQGVSQEELTFWYNHRQSFLEMLKQWREADRLECGGIQRCQRWRSGRKVMLQDQIWKALNEARQAGCFASPLYPEGDKAPTLCDWAPEDLVDHVFNVLGNQITATLELCYEYAPSNFQTLRSGYTALEQNQTRIDQVTVGVDPTSNPERFTEYLQDEIRTRQLEPRWFAQLANELSPAERPVWGQHWGDGDGFGNKDYFWAGYEYGAGWEVIPPQLRQVTINGSQEEVLDTCGSNASAYAFFNAGVTMFNRDASLVDVSMEANAAGGLMDGRLKLFGFNVWTPDDDQNAPAPSNGANVDYQYNYVLQDSSTPEGDSVGYTIKVFSIVGVDIFVRVGASAAVGITFDGRLDYGIDFSTCATQGTGAEFGVNTMVRAEPFASADGFVEAGFSFLGIEVGVGGRLTVIEAGLPAQMEMSLGGGAYLGAVEGNFSVSADVSLDYTLLQGSIYAFAEYWIDEWRKTLYRFGGYHDTIPLFSRDFDWQFGQAFRFCQVEGIDCDSLGRVRPGGLGE